MHLATTVKSIYEEPAKAIVGIGVMWFFLACLHWLAIDMIDWIDGWMNSEENSIVDGLQPFMLIRAAATNATPVALLSPKPVLSLQTKPSLPPSSRQTDLHRHLPCNVALKSSTLSSAQSGRRSSWYSTSSEHSMEPQFSTTPALCTSKLRRHSEPIPSLAPLKKLFDVHPGRPPLASEEVNPTSADSVSSLAAAASDSDGEELSSVALAKTSWVRICVGQFEALQN
ncbi:hypothetical protein KC343_g18885 [Hortaea werneckii]|nr:hypothetical protein KC338_g7624 [Hortaea werneckii]KAI6861364.1 hypothetical protein KC323_g5883 [Hortaea werneckii]KAI7117038.1 hypothetical protein KC352_g33900 [Hortaea werneckii]KAI7564511.1 hypothetical protein KC317_g7006 [Hortaea werneckii]KAI7588499.1 hypothetical protein KC343_g18885 [Hortaea werneckii]